MYCIVSVLQNENILEIDCPTMQKYSTLLDCILENVKFYVTSILSQLENKQIKTCPTELSIFIPQSDSLKIFPSLSDCHLPVTQTEKWALIRNFLLASLSLSI